MATEEEKSQPQDQADGTAQPSQNEKTDQPAPPDTSPPEPEKKGPPGGYDSTPIPHAPPGYNVKITFHRATSLPIADLSSLSSDPYIHAVLTTDLPKRHKEDPDLGFRTETAWRTTEPEWEQEWYLANIPASGFKLKARIYDEDLANHDDRLGNVHVDVGRIDEQWEGIHNHPYKIRKRSGSKRAYLFRAFAVCAMQYHDMSGELFISVEVLGKTPGDEGGRAYTIGKNYWCKHYSPLLGRIVGSKNPHGQKAPKDVAHPEKKESSTSAAHSTPPKTPDGKRTQRYNFESNQFQLQGPVPAELYHRYVEFRPFMKSLFTSTGLRGVILSKALHHQHIQVYNFNRDTLYGVFDEPCQAMTKQFLDSVHYAEGGRIFTYVITLDALMRFTETGKEFSIDMLSKHTMHSDRSIYIAFSGEFFVRKLRKPYRPAPARAAPSDNLLSHNIVTDPAPSKSISPDAVEDEFDPSYYELVIDNDSGTYRPNAKLLPKLKGFLKKNFPGLKIVTLDCVKDEKLMQKLKQEQRDKKKALGHRIVYTQTSRSSSISSSEEERLDELERVQEEDENATLRAKHKIEEAVAPLAPSALRHKLESSVATAADKHTA